MVVPIPLMSFRLRLLQLLKGTQEVLLYWLQLVLLLHKGLLLLFMVLVMDQELLVLVLLEMQLVALVLLVMQLVVLELLV